MTTFTKDQAIGIAHKTFAQKYNGALFAMAAGSIIRGDGVPYSDLDLTVIYQSIPCAYRESFIIDGLQVEAFVHDIETIQSFMDGDYKNAHVSMIHMLATGVAIPDEGDTSLKLRRYAQTLLDKGPPPTEQKILDVLRYNISDLIDDLKGERPVAENRATLYRLYDKMSELYMRQNNQFIPVGKHLPRFWQKIDPAFFTQLDNVMVSAHSGDITTQDIKTLEKLLSTLGGYLFDGYKSEASTDKRKTPVWIDA